MPKGTTDGASSDWITKAIEAGYGEPIRRTPRENAQRAIFGVVDHILFDGFTERTEFITRFLAYLSALRIDQFMRGLYFTWGANYYEERMGHSD